MGVRVMYYHASSGRFTDNGFIQDCKIKNQSISYCWVNAVFQNGIAEKKIRELQEQTRTDKNNDVTYPTQVEKHVVSSFVVLWVEDGQ